MIYLVLLGLAAAAAVFTLNAWFLTLVGRTIAFLGLRDLKFTKALFIVTVASISGILLSLPFRFLPVPFWFAEVVGWVGACVVTHLFLRSFGSTWKRSVISYSIPAIATIICALLVVVFIRGLIFEPFIVSGQAMAPTLQSRDYIFIQKIDRDFQRGDIVTYEAPYKQGSFFVGRIVALPGEEVSFSEYGEVQINSELLPEPYIQGATQASSTAYTVAGDEYFIMGDNRARSSDSRFFGSVPEQLIRGKFWVKVTEGF